MKLPLSSRLLACCDFIPRGSRVADIGCDHGYLSIHLLTSGIASSIIASDINQAPLDSAVRNAQKFGVHENIRFYLSDGVKSIPRDFDAMVCAGMGADTMIHILESAPWLRNEQYTLILQCQSKSAMLRQYLSESGWFIDDEVVLRDGKFLYTVMKVIWRPGFPLTAGAWYFPPAIPEKHPTAQSAAYYHWVMNGLKIKLSGQGDQADAMLSDALRELELLAANPNLSWLKEETK